MPFWKEDWDLGRKRLQDWWDGKGCALHVSAWKETPWETIPEPERPADLVQRWTDPEYRVQEALATTSKIYHGGAAFPLMNLDIGPGSLGAYLGSEPGFAETTVWFHPCIDDLDHYPPIRFDPSSKWFQLHKQMLELGVQEAAGRCLVGMPDLIENIDTLAQLRDPQTLMMDLIERPDWVVEKVEEINRAFFEAFEILYSIIKDERGGNSFSAFCIYGEGKTAKVQCDACAMFSPEMFRQFVQPSLRAQCDWLDYAMYHLDGTQCIVHLDALLEIESLKAIEWTPQAGIEQGGHPRWYDLYRRIKSGGKSVQAVGVAYDEVLPLLDAVGHEGMFVRTWADSEEQARALEEKVYG